MDELPELSRTMFRNARRLLARKGREDAEEFLAEGAQAVREALRRPGTVEALIVDDPARHAELVALAPLDRVFRAHPSDIAELSDTVTTQGVFAVCRQFAARLDDITEVRLAVICAQIRDPGNAGTVIRCADAFGADIVILTKGSVEVFNPKTVRSSVGSVFHIPVVGGVALEDAVAWVRSRGCQVLAADGDGVPLHALAASGALTANTAWIMGNEAWGLPAGDAALADQVIAVPMWGQAESLNLSTAAAICLYETARCQHPAR